MYYVFPFLTKMVPSNFKQNVKENPNLMIEKTREDNKQREKDILQQER